MRFKLFDFERFSDKIVVSSLSSIASTEVAPPVGLVASVVGLDYQRYLKSCCLIMAPIDIRKNSNDSRDQTNHAFRIIFLILHEEKLIIAENMDNFALNM